MKETSTTTSFDQASSRFGMFNRLRLLSLRTKTSLAVIVTAAVLVEVTSIVQYLFASEGIQHEVEQRAESELRLKSVEIRDVMNSVEIAVDNMVWAVEAQLNRPDSIATVTRRLVLQNEQIVGVGVMFVADYYQEYGRWCELYVAQRGDSIETTQIGSASHDYLSTDRFREGIAAGRGCWTEPYYDDAGARQMLCTYTMPLRDRSGQTVALIGADVSLQWLSEVVNARPLYPSSYSLLLSPRGNIIACPVDSLVLRQSIGELTADMEDTTVSYVNRQMMAGHSGQAVIHDDKGEKQYVFYAQMDDDTGWSMAVVCADREIYYGLRQVGFNLLLLMLVGLALLAFIIWRAARSVMRLQAVNAEKERIASELGVARGIQQSMIPKTFPGYPNRDDVELYASLTPAREVGGDFYDFLIRGHQLCFCIGDVSGKGVPAALLMTVMRSLFRTEAGREGSAAAIVQRMNTTITSEQSSGYFATMFVGVLDLQTGRLDYCNAGHETPLLAGQPLPVLRNLPVGVLADWTYEEQTTTLPQGQTLFLYTDGLSEARDQHGCSLSRSHVADVARQTASCTPREVVVLMGLEARRHADHVEQSDDITLMAICWQGRNTLALQADGSDLTRLKDFVLATAQRAHLDEQQTQRVRLAVEEAVTNIVRHAHATTLTLASDVINGEFLLTITDDGQPFDPTTAPVADTNTPADQRDVGGLGLLFIRQMSDTVTYRRDDGKNVLVIKKKISK